MSAEVELWKRAYFAFREFKAICHKINGTHKGRRRGGRKTMSAYHPKEIEFLKTIRDMKHDVGYGRMLQIILYEWNESHPQMTHRTVGDKNQKDFHAAKRGDPIAPIAGWDEQK